ncbi:hypothetical protein [Bacillus cereus]|nr:hypothetical protein [Bacillus cereus]
MSNTRIALVSHGYLLVKRFKASLAQLTSNVLIASAGGVDNDEVGRSVR